MSTYQLKMPLYYKIFFWLILATFLYDANYEILLDPYIEWHLGSKNSPFIIPNFIVRLLLLAGMIIITWLAFIALQPPVEISIDDEKMIYTDYFFRRYKEIDRDQIIKVEIFTTTFDKIIVIHTKLGSNSIMASFFRKGDYQRFKLQLGI